MRVSLIVAMTPDRIIGRDGGMPWHLPADLKRFRELTMGHPMIMGRRTFESLGRILPGRRHIVVTHNTGFKCPGVDVAPSLNDALTLSAVSDEVFVIGGAQIFREALPLADRLYITLIAADIKGDTFFPEFEKSTWREVAREVRAQDDENRYPLTLLIFERENAS
ncbi:MAG: dihydrofolate reductase [Gammaproteobacteria bacterium]|nr:dihydrofolate reductase [Gammaproteobacteria bacterium]